MVGKSSQYLNYSMQHFILVKTKILSFFPSKHLHRLVQESFISHSQTYRLVMSYGHTKKYFYSTVNVLSFICGGMNCCFNAEEKLNSTNPTIFCTHGPVKTILG